MAIAVLMAGLSKPAYAFTFDGLNYSVISESEKTAKVASQGESTSISGRIAIPSKVFYNGSEYKVIVIIGDAFIECRNITKIVVPSTVTTIGGSSFAYCSKLETLDLGAGVTNIGADLFTGLGSLKNVISRNPNPPYVENWGTVRSSATLFVPEDAIDAYAKASIWSYFSEIEPLNNLGLDLFGFKDIQSITVGNLVEEVDEDLFAGCAGLKELKLGSGLKKIGNGAFSGCTALTEVIVPPAVDSIGASAFAGNTNLATIIMGHSVKVIGEKAFDGCPATTISITAPTPPTAPNNTFSNYTGKLYLQGKAAVDAYYDAYTCWDRFNGYVMIEPTGIEFDGNKAIEGVPGDTFQLSARLMPQNVTLPQIFWRSTNPDIATVDENGLVTLHASTEEVLSRAPATEGKECKIIAESLYADAPLLEVTVTNDDSGIEDVVVDEAAEGIDFSAPVEVYNMSGMFMGQSMENLASGIYIVRQGSKVQKIAVK